MADCTLTDEDFSLFVFNYLTENAESQFGSVAGEDRLYSDFPEIDLSQLDVNDLDSVSCLSELRWDNDQTEISSSQYSTDDSELFEIIEEENEALLAALTETLDDIQEDDVSLSAFKELADGVVTDSLETASLSTPDGSPPTTKADEPSLLRKLLLAPQNVQLNYERQKGSNTMRHASSNYKSKSHRPSIKVEGPQGSKPHSTCQRQHRAFTELHKHLTSTTCPSLFKTDDSKLTNKDQSSPVWTSQYHQSHHQQGESEDDGDVNDNCVNDGANKELDCFNNGNGEHKQGHNILRNDTSCVAPIKSEDVVASAKGNWTKSTQFTTEAELHSVIELIKYMHTYCLPPRKYLLDMTEQGGSCNGSYKKQNTACSLQKLIHPGVDKQNPLNSNVSPGLGRSTPDMCKWNIRKLSKSSILRELLEKNIAIDVSKPYRLHNPLYPVYTLKSGKVQTVLPQVAPKHECDSAYCTETIKCTLEKHRKKCNKSKAAKMGDTARKQGNTCLAVRRSLRLNPQANEVLSSDLESASGSSLTRVDLKRTLKKSGSVNMQMMFEEEEKKEQVAEIEIDCSGQQLCDSGAHIVPDDQRHLQSYNRVQWTEENNNEESSFIPDLPTVSMVPCCNIVEDYQASTAQDFPLNETKMQEIKTSRKLAKPTSLLLSPESESDSKDSPLENKPFEQTLSVELCGTAGLTPPTTPPHKTTRDDPFKTAIKIESSVGNTINQLPSKNHWSSLSKNLVNKHPEQTELYAYLSKATVTPIQMEGKKVKRSYTRCFGDHDYCQLYRSETETERNILRLYELPNSSGQQHVKEKHDNYSLYSEKRQKMSPIPNHGPNSEKVEMSKELPVQSSNKKSMRDQEIRAKLFKHFGYPEEAITEEEKQHTFEGNDCDPNKRCYYSDIKLQTWVKKPDPSSWALSPSISFHKQSKSPPKDPLHPQEHQFNRERTKPCSNQQHKTISGASRTQSRSPVKRESARPWVWKVPSKKPWNSNQDKYSYKKQIWKEENSEKANQMDKKKKAMDECRIIYVGKLACNITQAELKHRFEIFGEIEECKLLSQDRGDKYGYIAYRYSEDASFALKNGHNLQKQNEPALQLCYGGLRRFRKTSYTDLDSSAEDLDPAPIKSKYDTMDFDSLLKEAQKSLTR
ncbi:peroxisome proliferator-activated receptor gamma coactivator 1-alpha isoform X3 [Carcharodon carcharias]|uniref:peroxisome proliferator-activated receptor gamma coactivator 1-alpha isoform X3 n=1 Tax=Carcharodon carcharias TaxID=13397 RepID=UPI001B7ECE19|nr:peroxisome proliferator-activated receptor gamma coactivator 1-alpha isoform X3 [Carcharodon carcharias]